MPPSSERSPASRAHSKGEASKLAASNGDASNREGTRARIVQRALALTASVGFDGLDIGDLAAGLEPSKSVLALFENVLPWIQSRAMPGGGFTAGVFEWDDARAGAPTPRRVARDVRVRHRPCAVHVDRAGALPG